MRKLLILFVALTSFACTEQSADTAEKKIPDEALVALLVDLHLTDAERGTNQLSDAAHLVNVDSSYTSVLVKHKISSADFKETMTYYSAHPEKLASLYDGVVEKLTAMQGSSVKQEPYLPVARNTLDHSATDSSIER
ncbi:MAG: hypothetical protein RIQ47_1996 [Bacteroidota bacterium]|jgi:hypothetical protein